MYGFKDWNMHAIKQQQKIEEKNRPCRYINPSVNMVNRQMHEFNARSYSVPILIKIKTKSSLKLYFSVHVFHWVSKKFLVILFFFLQSYPHVLPSPVTHTNWDSLAWTRCLVLLYSNFCFSFHKYRIRPLEKISVDANKERD